MRWLVLAALCLICACASTPAPVNVAARLENFAVSDAGPVATFYRPTGSGRLPGIVVVGGSEGGLEGAASLARPLAEQGYATLAVAFFGADGLPAHLQEVPLAYFDRAIDWLRARPDVNAERIGLIGGSKGAEAVLLVATRRHDLASLIAAAPSYVAWQGINREDPTPRSSWRLENRPTAYVPLDRSQPFTTIHDLYLRSRARCGEARDAPIPVEQIRAPLLLLAGEADALWDSASMSRQISARLGDHQFQYKFRHVVFADAGHDVFGTPGVAGASGSTQ